MKNDNYKRFMQLAIQEQEKCVGYPKVGCIIIKNNEIIATGYRGETDKNIHAERVAIEKLTDEQLKNSTLFTTLEPCIEFYDNQKDLSCTSLIINSGITCVFIGVLDSNGIIYSNGYKILLKNNIKVRFFLKEFRDIIENNTYGNSSIDKLITENGRRIVPVLENGIELLFSYINNTIKISFNTLQYYYKIVDICGKENSIRIAAGITNFLDIVDCSIFRFPNYYARMNEGMIVIVTTDDVNFYVLVKLNKIHEKSIDISWELRKK